MTARWGAPAPDGIRHILRAPHHPARSVPCPHCGARPHTPCTTRSKRRRLDQPHPSRITAWVRDSAPCPECCADTGLDCHDGGWNLTGGAVHAGRADAAKDTAA